MIVIDVPNVKDKKSHNLCNRCFEMNIFRCFVLFSCLLLFVNMPRKAVVTEKERLERNKRRREAYQTKKVERTAKHKENDVLKRMKQMESNRQRKAKQREKERQELKARMYVCRPDILGSPQNIRLNL